MTSLVSMSESIQASIIIQHQLQQQLRQHPDLQQQLEQKQQQEQQQRKGVGLCVQVLLVCALFGVEMCVAFEQIYEVLFLQYLSVPVSLVSVNGIICGGTSMIILPALGFLADRGSSPKLRKLLSLFIGMCMFLGGLVLLAACGFIKLTSLQAIVGNKGDQVSKDNVTRWTGQVTSEDSFSNTTIGTFETTSAVVGDPDMPATQPTPETAADLSSFPVTVVMSIIGFACIDIGFDISVSLTRAFILENIPTFQHTRILIMATVTQAIAGTTFCLIGCFDFPGLWEPIFHVDGVAVTLIFFCVLLICIVLIGSALTIATGFCLFKSHSAEENVMGTQKPPLPPPPPPSPASSTETIQAHRRHWFAKNKSQLQQLQEDRPFIPDILHTEEGDASTKPLLADSLKGKEYLSMSNSSVHPAQDVVDMGVATRNANSDQVSLSTSSASIAHREIKTNTNENMEKLSESVELPACEQQLIDHGVSAVMATIRQSYSMSQSVISPPLGDFHTRKLAQLQNQSKILIESAKKDQKKLKVDKRLTILVISAFFSAGSMLGFTVYVSNALTIGILHGDPTAQPGTEGHELYQEGLRTGAMGNLALYCSYMVVSLSNKKLIDMIGEKAQYVLCHAFLIVSLTTLLLTKDLEVYFIFMVFCGAFRTCVFTVPFVLANKFSQGQNDLRGVIDPEKPVKNIGKVMSVIGFLIPCHYIILSIFMGPLMDSTGNVWIPLIYSLCCASAALVIFSSLYLIKR